MHFFLFPTHAGGYDVALGEKDRIHLFDGDDVLVEGRLGAEAFGLIGLRFTGESSMPRAYW